MHAFYKCRPGQAKPSQPNQQLRHLPHCTYIGGRKKQARSIGEVDGSAKTTMEATIGEAEAEATTGRLEPGKPSTLQLADHPADVVPDFLYLLFDDGDQARRSLLLTPRQLEERYLARLAMDAEYDGDDEACGICHDEDEDEDDDEDMSTRLRWVFDRFWANMEDHFGSPVSID